MTIGELLTAARQASPDHEAIVSCHQGIRLSYKQLDEASDHLAKGLLRLGLKPGDRLGIWSPNNVEWILTMYASAKLGLVLVNVNPAYRPAELEYALNKVGCKALVMADRFKTSNYPEMVCQIAPEASACQPGHLQSARLPSLEILVLIGQQPRDGFFLFDDVSQSGRMDVTDLQPYKDACDVQSPVNIQFTSGTTGSPKGATLTHHNIVNNGFYVGEGIALGEQDRLCAPVPLYHCFGMVMGVLACAAHRATLVLPDDAFDPLSTLQAVENERCSVLYGVPTMFSAILDSSEFETFAVDCLRTGIVAGAVCPEVLMQRIIGDLNMQEVTNCYGMTETSPVSFQSGVDDDLVKRTTTVGRVHPHVEVKVIDPEGAILPRGVRGEVCTKGYSVMQGYWDDDERTTESIVDGWMLTGDEGVLDDDGYCSIVGRIKDTIIRGGENIAPKEIEEYLLTHDDILEAQAFGVPDEKYGEIVCVWIKKAPDSDMNEAAVQDYCKEQIAHFKVPAIVRFVDEYPLTVTGKVQKFVMREAMIKALKLA
ncbi:MAG: AMP-binding protein [Gammaproteobacteria bacterium]|nr:AMP-binding protein [Gammaproteobacteria bacterium]